MATTRPSLDQAPPLPPNLRPAPQPTVSGLAGQPQGDQSGGASLQKAVIEKLTFVEQALGEVTNLIPAAGPVVESLITQMRQKFGQILVKGANPAPAASAPGSFIAGPPTMQNAGGA